MKQLLLLFILIPFMSSSQVQIGSDIIGEALGDRLGWSLSLSSDGSIIAIGSPTNDGNGEDSGNVRVYENQSGNWVQTGQDINGEIQGDEFGACVSLSSNGSIVAISAPNSDVNGTFSGQVSIYRNENGIWSQIGQDINGDNTNNRFGSNISLSSDGSIIAIGAPGNNGNDTGTGYARIFKNINNLWIQIGNDLIGDFEGAVLGGAISLSSDGNIVAIGAPSKGPGSPAYDYPGYVKVYENINNVWTQIGNEITRGVIDDSLGSELSLSDDGNTLAIGIPNKNGIFNQFSIVKVYELVNNEWIELGQQLQGQSGFYRVSLSSLGNILTIGSEDGFVRVYQNINDVWTPVGQPIFDDFGWSVNLSSNGSIVATGSPFDDSFTGKVGIYDLSTLLSIEDQIISNFKIYPNPAKDQFSIQLNDSSDLKNITIYNNLGQSVLTSKETIINTSKLASGLYTVEVETTRGKDSKKLIIE